MEDAKKEEEEKDKGKIRREIVEIRRDKKATNRGDAKRGEEERVKERDKKDANKEEKEEKYG